MSKSDKLFNSFRSAFIILVAASLFTAAALPFLHGKTEPSKKETRPVLNKEPIPTTLFFGGDIMLSRNVGTKIFQASDPTLPFQKVADTVRIADIAFANLESPFHNKGSRVTQGLVFKAEPNTIEGLVYAGFDILSTANNHAYDQGKTGINFTIDWLKQNSITPIGTGLACHDGSIVEKNGVKFGFLAYSYTAYNDGGKVPDANVCDWNDQKQVVQDIRRIKTKADVTIVSTHMGTEYKLDPDERNVTLAQAAIDAGADLIIGHHPHWIQTTEQYKGKWIIYSLGNFVFDQMWSQETREGLTAMVTVKNKEITKIELKPVIIDNYCCPRWADETESSTIFKRLNLTTSVLVDKN